MFISFDKERMINVFIKTVLPWFFNISNIHFSMTFAANYFLVNQKQNWKMFKTHDMVHPCQMYEHDRVNCNALLSNYYFFLWYVMSEHWTTARTLSMKIRHNIPKTN